MRFLKEIFVKLLLLPIKFYRQAVSPYTPASCRHVPTCSEYAQEALKIHGVKGLWLTVKRLSKCHPWGTSGYDPVPPRDEMKTKKLK